MQKIGFCDKYLLTQAVLDGTKTMTRRLEKGLENLEEGNFYFNRATSEIYLYGEKGTIIERIKTRYKLGEVVAVAQAYKDTGLFDIYRGPEDTKGWCNKMFVRADLMPHQIQITDINIERLQDISNTDCLKEGIILVKDWEKKIVLPFTYQNNNATFATGQMAFAALIDKISSKGTWERNPFVVVYEFKLVK